MHNRHQYSVLLDDFNGRIFRGFRSEKLFWCGAKNEPPLIAFAWRSGKGPSLSDTVGRCDGIEMLAQLLKPNLQEHARYGQWLRDFSDDTKLVNLPLLNEAPQPLVSGLKMDNPKYSGRL
ncbi:hypothetical protein [Methylophilus sp. 3sh_L]|uniref:hypothetical protein n=1 Tax=Methylophilus sp. 3sh_L TaxID=3377114 RepID=UPI00398EE192